MAKTQKINMYTPKTKKSKGRYKKKRNKHNDSKSYRGQGR